MEKELKRSCIRSNRMRFFKLKKAIMSKRSTEVTKNTILSNPNFKKLSILTQMGDLQVIDLKLESMEETELKNLENSSKLDFLDTNGPNSIIPFNEINCEEKSKDSFTEEQKSSYLKNFLINSSYGHQNLISQNLIKDNLSICTLISGNSEQAPQTNDQDAQIADENKTINNNTCLDYSENNDGLVYLDTKDLIEPVMNEICKYSANGNLNSIITSSEYKENIENNQIEINSCNLKDKNIECDNIEALAKEYLDCSRSYSLNSQVIASNGDCFESIIDNEFNKNSNEHKKFKLSKETAAESPSNSSMILNENSSVPDYSIYTSETNDQFYELKNKNDLLETEIEYIESLVEDDEFNKPSSILKADSISENNNNLIESQRIILNLNNVSKDLKNIIQQISKFDSLIQCLEGSVDKHINEDRTKITEILQNFENEKLKIELYYSQNLENQRAFLNSKFSHFLKEIFDSIINSISSINLAPLFHSLEHFETIISNHNTYNRNTKQEIILLNNQLNSKNEEVTILEEKLNLLKAKSQILEESIDYLNVQNEKLKFRNHHLGLSLNIITAQINNINNTLSDLANFGQSLMHLYDNLEKFYDCKYKSLQSSLLELQNNFKILQENLDLVDVERYKLEFTQYIEKIVTAHENEKSVLEKRLNDLLDEIGGFKRENLDLQEENLKLKDLNKELKDEFKIKDSYVKDLEKSIDDLMKSNKFYEDQLIRSDQIIKSLKDARQTKFMDLSAEIEKIKKHYVKENGLLKLRIEELENSNNL